jgi:hypothetical protein
MGKISATDKCVNLWTKCELTNDVRAGMNRPGGNFNLDHSNAGSALAGGAGFPMVDGQMPARRRN